LRVAVTACTTPLVYSWRIMTLSMKLCGCLTSLGLTQRMKCVLVSLSVLTSSVSDVRKWSMTPTNLALLKRFLPPVTSSFSLKRSATISSSENCISTVRSCESGSLFFIRKPLESYVTLPG